ncbi:MAG: hypothetical protein HZB79_04455 [Deltaproteobacteria bacterium]|nr:hypothetical protein [Deltaproteobacteria bacterium]
MGYRSWIMGHRLWMIVFFLLPITYHLSPDSFASEHIQIEAYSILQVVDGNAAQAKEMAFHDALRNAVEDAIKGKAFEIDIEKNRKILNDKIFSNASAYILNYRILTEELTEEAVEGEVKPVTFYTVFLEVSIAKNILKNDLLKFGIIKAAEGEEKTINLILADIFNYKDFSQLKNVLENLKGVKDVFYMTFAHGKIKLAIVSATNVNTIKQELISKDFDGFKIEAASSSDDTLDLKIIKKEKN